MGKSNIKFEIPIGGINEFPYFILSINYKINEYDNICPHVISGILPIGIIAMNEAGHNHTIVCGNCITEAIKKHTITYLTFKEPTTTQ